MAATIIDVNTSGFEVGDFVYLKSGSPMMTIARVERDMASVIYVDKAHQPCSVPMPLKCLRKKFDPELDTQFMPDRK